MARPLLIVQVDMMYEDNFESKYIKMLKATISKNTIDNTVSSIVNKSQDERTKVKE
jgi:hypothetical protein